MHVIDKCELFGLSAKYTMPWSALYGGGTPRGIVSLTAQWYHLVIGRSIHWPFLHVPLKQVAEAMCGGDNYEVGNECAFCPLHWLRLVFLCGGRIHPSSVGGRNINRMIKSASIANTLQVRHLPTTGNNSIPSPAHPPKHCDVASIRMINGIGLQYVCCPVRVPWRHPCCWSVALRLSSIETFTLSSRVWRRWYRRHDVARCRRLDTIEKQNSLYIAV